MINCEESDGSNVKPQERMVRCVRIDAKRHIVREEFHPATVLVEDHARDVLGFTHSQFVGTDPFLRLNDQEPEGNDLLLSYHQPDPSSCTGLQTYGFVFDGRSAKDIEKRPMDQWEVETTGIDCSGDGLLTAYRAKVGPNGRREKGTFRDEPTDFPWSLEAVRRRIPEWTRGVLRRLPEFTCMLESRFDDPSQLELLLRIDNEHVLNSVYDRIYGMDFERELIRHLSPQLLAVSVGGYDLQIVMGRAGSKADLVKASIYRIGDPRLPLVDSVSLMAQKIPQWICMTLERFFTDELVTKKAEEGRKRRLSWSIKPAVDAGNEGEQLQ